MRATLYGESDLELSDFGSDAFEIESRNPEAHFAALQMFATSLALCTYSMLDSYGEQIDITGEAIRIRVRWHYAEEPLRVERIEMAITWPGLPPSRLEAAKRAAGHCTLHNTLARPPQVSTEVSL